MGSAPIHGLSPIVGATVQEEVYLRLRNAIQSGSLHLPDGDVTIRELARVLNVSTTPVREALRRLEAENLITIRSRSGVVINRLSVSEFADVTEMRVRLEPLLIERAVPRIGATDIDQLRGVLRDLDGATDTGEWRALNQAFHFGIYRLAGSPRILAVTDVLWNMVEPYIRMYSRAADLTVAQHEHRTMLDAIAHQDVDTAAVELVRHIRRAEAALLQSPGAGGLLVSSDLGDAPDHAGTPSRKRRR